MLLKNIFLLSQSTLWVKIGDFGIAKRIRAEETTLHTYIGTHAYMAPEIVFADGPENIDYTNAVDIWSMGCILYQMLTQKVPFDGRYQTFNQYYKGETKSLTDDLQGFSRQGLGFLLQVMAPQAKDRPAAVDVQKLPWLIQEQV